MAREKLNTDILKLEKLESKDTYTGTSFLIVDEPKKRKSRSLGTLPGETIFLGFDGGSKSAKKHRDLLGITDSVFHDRPVSSLEGISKVFKILGSNKGFLDNIDNIVIEPYTIIDALIQNKIGALSRFEAKTKEKESGAILPYYASVQEEITLFLREIMTLKNNYNIIMTAHNKIIEDDITGGRYKVIQAFGKAIITQIYGMFDEVYTMNIKENEYDSKEEVKTKFNFIQKEYDMTKPNETGYFAGSRCIEDNELLKKGSMVADFREIYKLTGYILKKDRDWS
jgi:hypothetical protein